MSKSVGNVVKPLDLADVYGADAFRYFLLRERCLALVPEVFAGIERLLPQVMIQCA